MKRALVLVAAACLLGGHGNAHAALSSYLGLPGVNGESDAPGRPDVVALDSLTLSAGTLTVAKLTDSTSPDLASALLGGTPYSSATLSLYDAVATDLEPDAELVLNTALVSSIGQIQLDAQPGDLVAFSFASPSLALFLELPGVSGESSAPGHPGVIALDYLALASDSSFAVGKHVDSTSPDLQTALLLGTPFATARLLVYSDVQSQTQPDFTLVYQSALVSSIADESTGETALEAVFFAVGGVTVPEPAVVLLLVSALVAAGVSRFRSRRALRA